MAASLTTTIRLAPAAKRRVAAAAKRGGVSTHKFILDAIDRAAAPAKRPVAARGADATDARLTRLAAMVKRVHEAIEDELDYRLADARWQHHLKHKTRLLTGQEVWRGVGLQD